MKAIFNSSLLRKVVDILNTNYHEMAKQIHSCSRDTLRRGLMRGDIRFDTFIEICNAYHLNIWCFFLPMEDIDKPQKRIIIPKSRFRKLTFVPEMVTDYSNMPDKMWCKDVAEWSSEQCKPFIYLPVTQCGEPISSLQPIAEEDEENQQTETSGDNDHSTKTSGTNDASYIYNNQLFSALPSALGIARSDIGIACGRAENTYTYAVRQGNIRMRSLVDICNRYHVDIMLFFTHEEFIPMSIVIADDKWNDIVFHPERLNDFCRDGNQGGTLGKLNYSKQRLYRNVDPETTPMTARDLVDICNILHVTPDYFFVSAGQASDQRIARALNSTINSQQSKIDALSIEKRRLESQLRHLKAMQDMK